MTVISRLKPALRSLARADIALSAIVLLFLLAITATRPAHAMDIKQIKSPGGIEAWLVEDHSNPMMALRFAFEGGNAQDPAGKEGVANFLTAMLDEGAGDIKSAEFQEKLEDLAVRLSFTDSNDAFYGNLETLTANRDEASKLLALALAKPRFDPDAIERIRKQLLANIVYANKDPDKVAYAAWFETAFPGHPYGKRASGTEETVAKISAADLEAYRKRVFARSNLKVVAVGDITAEDLGRMVDTIFGALPEKADLMPVAKIEPIKGGKTEIIDMDVPQSVAVFGFGAMARKDPDFMPAFIVNHMIGGGGFASRLMEEVREKRGLAYSVYSYIQPFRHASIYSGSVATRNDAITTSLDIIRAELKKIATEGPTVEEFENAKSYLTGSYALRFDTNAKIATQLLGLWEEGFGPDYIENRNKLVEAVTLDDAKRVAKRLLDVDNLLVTIVGRPSAPAALADEKG